MKRIDEVLVKLIANQPERPNSTSNILSTIKSGSYQKENSRRLAESKQELILQSKALMEAKEKIRLTDITATIFNFLGEYYANSWTQGLERVSYEGRLSTWIDSLVGLTHQQIDYAKRKISSGDHHPTYPPTPGEFRKLCKSLPEDFQSGPSPQQHKAARFEPSHDILWFKGLNQEQKTKVYEAALKAYPLLEEMLKINKASHLDIDFEKSCWLKPMIEAFKDYYRIDSLRRLK